MRACLLSLVVILSVAGCGARSGLHDPGLDGEPETPPGYCEGTGPTGILVVTDLGVLFRFDPTSATFALIGSLGCSQNIGPQTMAVSHTGTVYITTGSGTMFEVDPEAGVCTPLGAPLEGIHGFGSAFSASADGLSEKLFVAADSTQGGEELVILDTRTFQIEHLGDLPADLGSVELAGSGDGRLFGFSNPVDVNGPPTSAHLTEISTANATVLSDTVVATPPNPTSWALVFWRGDFFFFTGGPDGDSTVARLAADGSFDASYALLAGHRIVGAGVSTCAPLQ